MVLYEITPSASLREHIRLYKIVDFHFPEATIIPAKVYTPRPEQCLQFYPRDSETVKYPGTGLIVSNKKVTLIGQHTVTNHRSVGKDFLTFQVVFQPGALFQITGLSMQEIANAYLDAEDIFGTQVRLVNEQLYCAGTYPQMVSIIEHFLAHLLKNRKKQPHAVETSGKLMLWQEEKYALDQFIQDACLCHRQFDRKFKERMGIAPKQFLQIIRFDKAFRMKNRYPHLDWLSIAVQCGYYDYQHLAKEYKEFTGLSPSQFFEVDKTAPERYFGETEV